MKKLVIFFGVCILCNIVFADTIKLKSGEVYEGKIVDRNDKYITLSTGGAPVYLAQDQIEKITSDVPSGETVKENPQPEAAVEQKPIEPTPAIETKLPLVFNESELTPQQQKHYQENYVTQRVFKVDLTDDKGVQERDLTADELVANAEVMMGSGRIKEAVGTLEKAVASDPGHKAAQHMLADIYNENGEPQKSIDIYSRLIQQDPEDYNLYNSRGYAYGRSGSAEKALEDYNKALSIKPDFVNSLGNRAAVYLRGGNIELAKKDYEELVKNDQEQGNFGLGNVAASNKEWNVALGYYDKVIQLSPHFPPVYMMRGQILLELGNEEKAAQDLKHAKDLGVSLAPDLEAIITNSKIQLEEKPVTNTPQTQPETATQPASQPAVQAVVQPEVNPADEALLKAYDFILKKDSASAIPILDKIIEGDPKNFLAYNYRGWCLELEKKYDEALKDYFKIGEINEEEGRKILKSIAYVYIEKENFYQASSRYYEYLRYFPDDGDAQYNLAISEFNQGALTSSLTELEKAKSLGVKDTQGLGEMILASQAAQEKAVSVAQQVKDEKLNKDMDKIHSDFKEAFSWKTLLSIIASLIIGTIVMLNRLKGQKAVGMQSPENMIKVRCECGKENKFGLDSAGKFVRCAKCDLLMKLPGIPAQPAKQEQGLSSGRLPAEGIFSRNRFYFSRKWSVTERYFVFDESGRHIMFVEKPIIAGNILASFLGIIAAIGLFILSLIAVGPILSPGMESVGGLLLATLVSLVIAVIGAGAIMSGMEKKRRVIIYRDETKNEKLLEIVQETKVVIIRTVYTLLGPQDQVIAKFRRNHFIDNFRRILKCTRPDGSLWFCAKEDSSWLAFLRRVLPLEGLGFAFLANFNFIDGNTSNKLGEFNRTSAILDKHVLDMSDDQAKILDRKVAVACAVLLDIRI
jgi:tetratricopeptide (TPR) repeat protein